jgi:predicted alpha/beta-hydrolase family hydrolase
MRVTRILLAPGASGNPAQLRRHRGGLEKRGYEVEIVSLPRTKAERAIAPYLEAIGDAGATSVIGGQSFGGRVATLVAADHAPAAVVCFSYPLHAPGRQPAWVERTSHWPRITCPVLLLSGTSDPFANIDLLRRAVQQLPAATLLEFPGLGHSLVPALDDALDAVDAFIGSNT